MPRNSLHRIILMVALLLTATSLVATPAASAQGPARDTSSEAGFLSSLNAQRAASGIAPLQLNSSMTSSANSWAQQMANGSFLAHASDIVAGTPAGWTKVGENVGRGQSVTSLTSAFMASPGHRANIMDPSFTHVGIAVYTNPSDGRIYTTHRFAALPGSVAAPAPAATATPAPTATPIPEPTATPAPTATPIPEPTATPAPTATPIPEPTATPAPTATPIPEPTATAVPAEPSTGFGPAPEDLAFVDTDDTADMTRAKLNTKLAKTLANQ